MTEYLIPAKDADAEFIERRSRFIGHIFCTDTEEQALARLKQMRETYWDATHNVYAYIIKDGPTRFSDDGEPGGTAGMPVLQVLQREEIYNVTCVVTRYFGGILLGAGGLVRAYAQGSRDALNAAGVVVMHKTNRYAFDTNYSFVGKLDHWLLTQPVQVNERSFGAEVTYDLSVRTQDSAVFLEGLTQLSQGRIEPLLMEEGYQPWKETEK